MKLLLVEDDDVDARRVSRALDRAGSESYVKARARTLQAAQELLRAKHFDAVLLDLGLPDSSGTSAIARLRDVSPQCIVIVLTGNDNEEMAAKALAIGAQDYLPKDAADGATLRRSLRYARQRAAATQELQRQRLELETTLAELKRSRESQLQLERLRTTASLTKGIAHEFNNALAVIMGNLELLSLDKLPMPINQADALAAASAAAKDAARVATALSEAFADQQSAVDLPSPSAETTLQSVIAELSGSRDNFSVRLAAKEETLSEADTPPARVEEQAERRILLVDDEPLVLSTLSRLLGTQGIHADILTDPLKANDVFDPAIHCIAIVDRSMPAMSGDELAEQLKARAPHLPVVMLTGYGPMMAQAGETPPCVDRVLSKPCSLKAMLAVLEEFCPELLDVPAPCPDAAKSSAVPADQAFEASVHSNDSLAHVGSEQHRTTGGHRLDGRDDDMKALSDEEIGHLASDWVQHLPDGLAFLDESLQLRYVNDTGARLLSTPAGDLIGLQAQQLPGYEKLWVLFEKVRQSGVKERVIRFVEPLKKWMAVAIYPSSTGVAVYFRDVSSEKHQEQAMMARAKVESGGELASGMAHDFNHLVSVIVACVDSIEGWLKSDREPDDTVARNIQVIRSAASTGSSVVGRLLRFARQQPLQPESCDLNEVLAELRPTMEHRLGPQIELEYKFSEHLPVVEMDRDEFVVMLLNLCSNARDAMNGCGTLCINAEVEECATATTGLPTYVRPGLYVRVGLSDTGRGIPEGDLERVLAPYYTTKADRGGTGLGLPSCFGFMKQSGGYLYLESQLGRGTTVFLLFPVEQRAASHAPRGEEDLKKALADIPVLVVDDDAFLREMFARQLESLGCTTVTAATAAQALEAMDADPEPQVLLTDLNLSSNPSTPSGADLARAVRKRYPDLAVVICTGDVDLASIDIVDRAPRPVKKPVQRDALGERIIEALLLVQK